MTKTPEQWLEEATPSKRGGAFKLFLGYAPGVGKTYTMLSEAIRRHARAEDVVIGVIESHGRKATADLLALQREDGGWPQLKTLGTDAYATGQVLYALHEGGALAVTDPAYQKGVRYLLRTQCEDGSWYVPTRAMPVRAA